MRLPISFDNVSYFKDEFRGDLIVAREVIYYFPHTNVAADKVEKKGRVPKYVGYVAPLFGPAGDLIQMFSPLAYLVVDIHDWLTRGTINRPRLGVSLDDLAAMNLPLRLDELVTTARSQSTALVNYQYSLPRPTRFAKRNLRNLRVSLLGTLRFDSEFDDHDFAVGPRRSRLLREALAVGGFIK